MGGINSIKEKNPHITIREITDCEFSNYGKVIVDYDFSNIIKYMEEKTNVPKEGNIYIATDKIMESFSIYNELMENFYGEMDIQIGYCNGNNSNLNGLEYHKGSEINVAVTDLILLLGDVREIQDNTYPSEKVEAFYLPKGAAVELYQTTLHFAPCKISDDGFKCIVVLPKETNTKINHNRIIRSQEDKLLFAKNKWLLVHPDKKQLIEKGAYAGIIGDNIEIKY